MSCNWLLRFFFNTVMDEINKNKTRKAIWFEYNINLANYYK